MHEQEFLLAQLQSLVVFRQLLTKNVVQKLAVLLQQNPADTCATVNAYSDFVAALYRHTDCFSDYLLKAVLDDENIYIRQLCEKSMPDDGVTACLTAELTFLQHLSQWTGETIRGALAFDGFLPQWRIATHDFAAIYRTRIAELPRKGFGIFAKYNVFMIQNGKLAPVKHPDTQPLNSLSGYERERGKVIANTKALLNGQPASNVLLYGDAGTGKSSTVKAVAGSLFSEGLRLIEVKKNQLYQIPDLVDTLSSNPLKFILFIDDLSFSTNDDNFAALKAILEGSVSGRSQNLAVYATSNRRHLIKESFSDREGDEIHLADTMQELMSLSARFGLTITYSRPDKDLYCHIVESLAAAYEIELPKETLLQKAEAHAIRNGGRSPRVAKQFIEQLKTGI